MMQRFLKDVMHKASHLAHATARSSHLQPTPTSCSNDRILQLHHRRHLRMPSSISAHAASGQAGPGTVRKVLVSHILVKQEDAQLLDKLEEQLKTGAKFEDLAAQHSMCGSAKKGGQLGWLEPNAFYPAFEAAAFATPVGQCNRATTARGHHLLKVLDEREDAVVQQMSVQELAELLENPALLEEVQLIDVREKWEADTASLPGFQLYPLSQFESWRERIEEDLVKDKQTVVLCHHGVRSMNMSQFLVQQGFKDVHNIMGGIDAYSKGVDSRVPLY